jgi:integrase
MPMVRAVSMNRADWSACDSFGFVALPVLLRALGFLSAAHRHAAASLFIAHLGWTPKQVQRALGHSSITMTFDHYGHLFEDREGDLEAMKRLEAAIVAA